MNRKEYLNDIAKYGLILFAICAGSMILSQFAVGPGAVMALLIWVAKTSGCIWVLYSATRKFAEKYNLGKVSQIFPYAFSISTLSNVAISAYQLIHFGMLFPIGEQQVATLTEIYSSALTGYEEQIGMIIDNYPELMSMSMLLYLTIFGTVASLIIAGTVRIRDPFRTASQEPGDTANGKEEDDDII